MDHVDRYVKAVAKALPVEQREDNLERIDGRHSVGDGRP
jgi:hypothetical protein